MLRFNLSSLIKRLRPGTRRKRIMLPDIRAPQVKADALNALLQRPVAAWFAACRDRLLPLYRRGLELAAQREASTLTLDDLPDDIVALRAEADAVALSIDNLIDQLLPELRMWAAAYEQMHRGRWGSALQPSGVQLQTLLNAVDVADTVEASLQANVALIRSLDSEAQTRVEGIIFRGFTNRTPVNQIAKELSEAVGLSRARARRIAAHQTQMLSSQLDTARMQQAGIDQFEWVHSGKVHFRPWHRARHGQTFRLEGDIAKDDMPGIPPFCGCRKRAVVTLE